LVLGGEEGREHESEQEGEKMFLQLGKINIYKQGDAAGASKATAAIDKLFYAQTKHKFQACKVIIIYLRHEH
jgi:hypothetical protein